MANYNHTHNCSVVLAEEGSYICRAHKEAIECFKRDLLCYKEIVQNDVSFQEFLCVCAEPNQLEKLPFIQKIFSVPLEMFLLLVRDHGSAPTDVFSLYAEKVLSFLHITVSFYPFPVETLIS